MGKKVSLFDSFRRKEKPMVESVLPNGVLDVSESYLKINDGGIDYYVRAMTIAKMPKVSVFAQTFARMTTFPNVDAHQIFGPFPNDKISRKLDRVLKGIEATYSAEKDTNRKRRLQEAYSSTESWARRVETGEIGIYGVRFIYLLYAHSLKELDSSTKRFADEVRGSMDVVCCYGAQVEAYMSCSPLNKVFDVRGKGSLLKAKTCFEHDIDDAGLCTIFPHTSFSSSHETGIPIGSIRSGGAPYFSDCFQAKEGFSQIFAGKTGVGKSLLVKTSVARYHELYHTRFACIDTKPVCGRGEYSVLCDELRGVNFVLAPNSGNKLNLFAVDYEEIYDSELRKVLPVLNLSTKVNSLTQSILNLAFSGRDVDVEVAAASESIVRASVMNTYRAYEIFDGKPESLYYEDNEGKVLRKPNPVFSDFFLEMLRYGASDPSDLHKRVTDILSDALSAYVDCLYYDTTTLARITEEEYTRHPNGCKCVSGSRPYFDGESDRFFDDSTPFINFDISALSEAERDNAQLIVLEYIMDNIVRKNGTGLNANRLVVLVDEAHRILRQNRAAILLDDAIRTVRTRMTSIWLILQSIKDIADLQTSESMLRNMAAMFLFKHERTDIDYVKHITGLTETQCAQIASLGGGGNDPKSVRKGECCVIENQCPVFIQGAYIPETEWRFAESDPDKRAYYEAQERARQRG